MYFRNQRSRRRAVGAGAAVITLDEKGVGKRVATHGESARRANCPKGRIVGGNMRPLSVVRAEAIDDSNGCSICVGRIPATQ